MDFMSRLEMVSVTYIIGIDGYQCLAVCVFSQRSTKACFDLSRD